MSVGEERIDIPKGKVKGYGMKLFQIMILLIAPLLFGCSEPNPLKWRPMDLAPAATLDKPNDKQLGSFAHPREGMDYKVMEKFHDFLPAS